MVKKKDKQQKQLILIVLAVITLFFLFSKGGWIGSLITECTNNEPVNISDYKDYFDSVNATYEADGTIELNNESHIKYNTWSSIGDMEMIDVYGMDCDDFLQVYAESNNNTEFINLNKRQVLTTQEGFMWCNYRNQVALRAYNVAVLSYYVDEFEVCTTTEIQDDQEALNETDVPADAVTDNQTCMDMRGELIEGVCMCCDGTVLMQGDICPDPEDCGETDDTSSSDTSSSGSSSSSGGSTTTDTSSQFDESNQDSTQDDSSNWKTIMLSLGTLVLVFLLYYFLYEKGDDRGFIKK